MLFSVEVDKFYVFSLDNYVRKIDGSSMYDIVKSRDCYTEEPLFSGTKSECEQWIKNQMKLD